MRPAGGAGPGAVQVQPLHSGAGPDPCGLCQSAAGAGAGQKPRPSLGPHQPVYPAVRRRLSGGHPVLRQSEDQSAARRAVGGLYPVCRGAVQRHYHPPPTGYPAGPGGHGGGAGVLLRHFAVSLRLGLSVGGLGGQRHVLLHPLPGPRHHGQPQHDGPVSAAGHPHRRGQAALGQGLAAAALLPGLLRGDVRVHDPHLLSRRLAGPAVCRGGVRRAVAPPANPAGPLRSGGTVLRPAGDGDLPLHQHRQPDGQLHLLPGVHLDRHPGHAEGLLAVRHRAGGRGL